MGAKLSAVALVAVTLWTFGTLQNSGPEGTLRSFIELSAAQNWDGVNRLLASDEQVQSLSAPEQLLLRQANYIGRVGPYRLVPIPALRTQRSAVISILSEDRFNGPISTTWVLVRPGIRWTVDLRATLLARLRTGTNLAPEP